MTMEIGTSSIHLPVKIIQYDCKLQKQMCKVPFSTTYKVIFYRYYNSSSYRKKKKSTAYLLPESSYSVWGGILERLRMEGRAPASLDYL